MAIFCLGTFISIGKKNDQQRSPLLKIAPVTRANVDLQLGHPSPDRPPIAWIAADWALNPGLQDRFSPVIPKAHEPSGELRSTPVCYNSGDVVLRLRKFKGSGEAVSEPRRDPENACHHQAAKW